ncbi:hypothetical protein M6B38_313440 [Iris pallida]|uniref:Uncharacterized protein n=1 Tax=Iris pallida TaxID=29817 RepID=A0AAX6HGP7_IRIPA|nr:hypothetical protein M6B38_382065 [Iris pallida]KAJ6839807.1 hypothetical protein M6B38_313440 [Iris pallida]
MLGITNIYSYIYYSCVLFIIYLGCCIDVSVSPTGCIVTWIIVWLWVCESDGWRRKPGLGMEWRIVFILCLQVANHKKYKGDSANKFENF